VLAPTEAYRSDEHGPALRLTRPRRARSAAAPATPPPRRPRFPPADSARHLFRRDPPAGPELIARRGPQLSPQRKSPGRVCRDDADPAAHQGTKQQRHPLRATRLPPLGSGRAAAPPRRSRQRSEPPRTVVLSLRICTQVRMRAGLACRCGRDSPAKDRRRDHPAEETSKIRQPAVNWRGAIVALVLVALIAWSSRFSGARPRVTWWSLSSSLSWASSCA